MLQSRATARLGHLRDFVYSEVSARQLADVHPSMRRSELSTSPLTLSSFLFPVDQALYTLGLRATHVFMNDDNKRFVDFTRVIAKRFNRRYGDYLTSPTLVHGVLPRLLGTDNEKMSKSRRNCIFLADTRESLSPKVKKLFRYGYFPHHENLPDTYLPFQFLKAFGGAEDIEAIEVFRSGVISKLDLAYRLEECLERALAVRRAESIALQQRPELLVDRVEQDTHEAELEIEKFDEALRQAMQLGETN